MSHFLTASALFRDRDLFVHDGARLRRFRLSASFQTFLLLCILALVAWSAYSIAQMVRPQTTAVASADSKVSRQVAEIAAATEARVRQIEERQIILAAMLAGEDLDPEVVAQLGYTLPTAGKGGVGGPFDSSTKADPTFKALFTSWKKLDTLSDNVISVPSDKPVKSASFESAYGIRNDPFEGHRKLHAGIDLAAPIGTPIHATADGTVSSAGYNNGGYGNLIKIDHGRGIETRYAHLSSIGVRIGQKVTRGQVIGRMGSTGRSTGSHLHYEVRIDGRAVNPVPFMKSNDYLLAMRRKAGNGSMDQIALGGPSSPKR